MIKWFDCRNNMFSYVEWILLDKTDPSMELLPFFHSYRLNVALGRELFYVYIVVQCLFRVSEVILNHWQKCVLPVQGEPRGKKMTRFLVPQEGNFQRKPLTCLSQRLYLFKSWVSKCSTNLTSFHDCFVSIFGNKLL